MDNNDIPNKESINSKNSDINTCEQSYYRSKSDIESIEDEFYKNGYIVVRNILPKSKVQNWSKQFVHSSFLLSIFQLLYNNNHSISYPSETIPLQSSSLPPTSILSTKRSNNIISCPLNDNAPEHDDTDTKSDVAIMNNSVPSSLSNTQQLQYTMKCGIKNGYNEFVMRSPGRYEIALLSYYKNNPKYNHQSNNNNKNNNNNNDDISIISSIINTIQQSLPFVPNLLNQYSRTHIQQLQQQKYNTTNSDATTTTTSVPIESISTIKQLTWDDVKIINISILISTPGSIDQKWHADGGHVNIVQHVPCHCCNIFIPFTDINSINGTTEFRPKSHYYTRKLVEMILLAKIKKSLIPIDGPIVTVGDAIVFDYRILHRGRGNRNSTSDRNMMTATNNSNDNESDLQDTTDNNGNNDNNNKNRVILVVTVALPWFSDILNFPKSPSIYNIHP